MSVLFVSFYTPNGKYPELAKKLEASLIKFGLNHYIEQVAPFKSWHEGVSYKSSFIDRMLTSHANTVVWMDVDTEVWQYPSLLFGEHDFAIYNWAADTNHHLDGSLDPAKLLCSGGVIKFGFTPAARLLLKKWAQKMIECVGEDDPQLDSVYNSQAEVKPLWLPKTYNRMDKHTHHWSDIPNSLVVINHDYTGGKHGFAS